MIPSASFYDDVKTQETVGNEKLSLAKFFHYFFCNIDEQIGSLTEEMLSVLEELRIKTNPHLYKCHNAGKTNQDEGGKCFPSKTS